MRDTCIALGARSISDFARSAACSSVGRDNGSPQATLETTVQRLHERIEVLDSELRRLTTLFEPRYGGGGERSVRVAGSSGALQYAARRKDG